MDSSNIKEKFDNYQNIYLNFQLASGVKTTYQQKLKRETLNLLEIAVKLKS
jgi:hypothetical protein